jgi:glycosyltransferase involved in cell wall biosynthesis
MVHDLSPLHYNDEGELPPWIDEMVERAALVFTPSAFTASELRRHLGVPEDRIRVIGGAPALEAGTAEPLSIGELHDLGIEPPLALRYGGYTKRKEVPLLLDAWARVPLGTLVLAGPSWTAQEPMLSCLSSATRAIVLDYVSNRLLARLLRSATVLVSTSEYEGFGLPPLEALAAGIPVVAVKEPFVQELCGAAAVLVERDPRRLAEALTRVLLDHELRERLRSEGSVQAAKFSWNRSASIVLDTYSSA